MSSGAATAIQEKPPLIDIELPRTKAQKLADSLDERRPPRLRVTSYKIWGGFVVGVQRLGRGAWSSEGSFLLSLGLWTCQVRWDRRVPREQDWRQWERMEKGEPMMKNLGDKITFRRPVPYISGAKAPAPAGASSYNIAKR